MTDLGALVDSLKKSPTTLADDFVTGFIDAMTARGLELYAAQEEALLEIASDHHIILNTPTGSGKSLVASALAVWALAHGRKVFYTCPIKALVSEKFFQACSDFGPERVGMMTGDASIHPEAPFICCTAEVLSSMALSEGDLMIKHAVVADEFHYYSDRDRGMAWQVPLIMLPQAQFLLMSATLGDTEYFEQALTARTQTVTTTIRGATRPVPLQFSYADTPLHETVQALMAEGKSPVYLVNFAQRTAAEQAQNLMSIDVCTKEEKRTIAEMLHGFRFDTPYGKELQRFVKHGIGLHHAGLLPKYRLLVERLAQKGLLKVISGTDTLGVGVNVPIRTVLFSQLCKYDGEKTAILTVRDFHQIAGRAGRRGFDTIGYVVAQAPEHWIENKRLEAKAAQGKKVVKRKPPDRSFVNWDQQTYERLQASMPEPLRPQFALDHSVVMAMLSDPRGGRHGYRRLREMIRHAHLDDYNKAKARKQAKVLLRELVTSGVVVCERWKLRLREDLDRDFSLHHSIELYLLDQLGKLEQSASDYPLIVLTLVEATLEDPNTILMRQVDKLKDAAMAEMKMEGVPYEERIAKLDEITYPKPMEEALYATFNGYREKHPYMRSDTVRPKSIAREMYEGFASFNDYVRMYGLERSEGVLLRYLSDLVRVLQNTVPEANKNDPLNDAIEFFVTMLSNTDRSLVDAWEKMFAPPEELVGGQPTHKKPKSDVELRKRLRTEALLFLKHLATRRYDAALEALYNAEAWTPERVEQALLEYFPEHERVAFDADARANARFSIVPTWQPDGSPRSYRVSAQLCGAQGPSEWHAQFSVSEEALGAHEGPLLSLESLASSV